MKAAGPIVIIHRRNTVESLASLPNGAWIELDVDLHNGVPVLTHDPLKADDETEPLAKFLPRALRRGAAGFVFDCKRENAGTFIKPLLSEHNITNYFYLNEMEVQADMFMAADRLHRTAARIWQYRGAKDLIRYAETMRSAKQNAPGWAWVDCWQRGLADDMTKAFVPLTQTEAHGLRKLEVKLCICSPELYVHDYEKKYKAAELEEIYRGTVNYRKKLLHAGVMPDAVCTKFPWLWTMDIDILQKAKTLSGV
jgi:hypothetical protein